MPHSAAGRIQLSQAAAANDVARPALEPRWMGAGRTLTLAAAAVALAAHVSFVLILLNVLNFGFTGISRGACDTDRFCLVEAVRADSPAAQAGIAPGQSIRWDIPIDATRRALPGDIITGTVRAADGARQVRLHMSARSWTGGNRALQISDLMFSAVSLVAIFVGVFLALRSRGRASVLLLGATTILAVVWGAPPPYWLHGRSTYAVTALIYDGLVMVGPIVFVAFAMQYRREATGGGGWRTRLAFRLYCALRVTTFILAEYAILADRPLSSDPDNRWYEATSYVGLVLTLAVMLAGRREAGPAQRDRFGLMIPGVILFMSMPSMGLLVELSGMGWLPSNPFVLASLILPMIGLATLTYALLRHRIVDLGFAVNRTLVYGLLSSTLLFVFWFAEWGIEQLITTETREASMLISAGIALALFLVFHRLRDWIERGIERLFFSAWRENEAQLDRFVREAAFVTRPEALQRASLAELSRFSGGAEAALFETSTDSYVRIAGDDLGLGASIEADVPAMVRLRSERLAQESELPGRAALLLPIVQRSEITGFFALGAKPSGENYRPDERDALAAAVQKIGHVLDALKTEAHTKRLALLELQNDQLRLALSLVGARP